MSRNLSATALAAKPATIQAAAEAIAYFKPTEPRRISATAHLTPLEAMYAYYDAA